MEAQVALITGASSGIGKATAKALAQRGLRVFAGVRRAEAGDTLRSAGITPVVLDVTSDEAVSTAAQTVLEQAGRIDVLVNNAGYGQYGSLEEVALADAQRQFDINVFGLMRVTRAVLPAMRRQGSGRIITISSVAAAFRRLVEGSFVRAPGPEVVAEAIAQAATARRAPIRMAVPGQARAMLLLKRLLSDRLFDAMISAQLRPSPEVQGKLGDSSRSTGRRA